MMQASGVRLETSGVCDTFTQKSNFVTWDKLEFFFQNNTRYFLLMWLAFTSRKLQNITGRACMDEPLRDAILFSGDQTSKRG